MSLKKMLTVLALTSIALPFSVIAVGNNSNQANTTTGTTVQTQTESQTETQTQAQTNNPEVDTMTQEQARTELQTELQKSEPTYTPEVQKTQTRLNAVSQAVQNILTIASRVATQNKSLSDEIQTVAQTQIQTQDKINQALDKAENRSVFSKFFIGPDYKQLKTAKQEMEQNRLRIQELNQIMSQITNTSDQTELKNQIEILELQNTNLEAQLEQDVSGFSLFGWLARWINKY